jgi:hypothetical protein
MAIVPCALLCTWYNMSHKDIESAIDFMRMICMK